MSIKIDEVGLTEKQLERFKKDSSTEDWTEKQWQKFSMLFGAYGGDPNNGSEFRKWLLSGW
jgi:hypothetical protein